MKKQNAKPETRNPKRRLFVFGPGIVAAVILSVFVFEKRFSFMAQKSPIIERQSIVSGEETTTYAPELTFLIANRKKFHLTKEQEKLAKNIFKKYYEDALPLKRQLKESTAQISSYFGEKKEQNVKVSADDIQKHSQEYQHLSGELSRLRRFYWEQGENLLTETQKGMVKHEIAKIFTVKRPAFKKEDKQ